MTFIFVRKCIDFQVNRYMQTNKSILKLPRELVDIEKIQQSHHNAVSQNMIIQWRDFLISEIQEKLQDAFPYFFKDNEEEYFKSELKPVITCYELMLNSFLREFVQTSI